MALRNSYKQRCLESSLYLFTGVIIAFLYYGVPPHYQKSIQDIKGAIFILSSEALFTHSYGVMYLFPTYYPLLRRETGEKLYSLSAFYVSKILLLVSIILFENIILPGIFKPPNKNSSSMS
jgi:ATP-binding cassette, subfamily G (WHITE), eye pigment precursor transporter